MPELPEVETVRSFLEQHLIDSRILQVKKSLLATRLRRPLSPLTDNIALATCKHISRRGKYLTIELDNHLHITIHLGMSGRIILANTPPESSPHNHITLKIHPHQDQSQSQWLVYHDPRRFGFFLVHNKDELPPFLAILGKEPFDLSPQELHDSIKKRSAPIKSILLNQRIMAGLGNIYVCEALWLCGIHPLEKGTNVSLQQSEKLLQAIQSVLQKALLAGGSTLRNYRQASGNVGNFQHSFNAYNCQGKTCSQCGGTIQKITISNRGSYFCNEHQMLACEKRIVPH